MSVRSALVVLAVVLVASTPDARAERVVRVKDGDSLVVASHGREVDVRLAYIDAPELDQPFGPEAKARLDTLAGGRDVDLALIEGGAYRRIIARVEVDRTDAGESLVEAGLAWVREAYGPPERLLAAQASARAAGRGLWADADPVPPWIWRKRAKEAPAKDERTGPVECGAKRYCKDMTSCEEAIAHLQQCGLKRLDRDGDGVPCESLCRYYR